MYVCYYLYVVTCTYNGIRYVRRSLLGIRIILCLYKLVNNIFTINGHCSACDNNSMGLLSNFSSYKIIVLEYYLNIFDANDSRVSITYRI